MIIDRIKFTKEFVYHGVREWIGLEASIEPDESEIGCLFELRQKTIDTFNASIKKTTTEMQPPEPDVLPVIQERKVTPGMQFIIDKINKATTPEQLEKERTRADMNPELKKVFDEQMKKLKP